MSRAEERLEITCRNLTYAVKVGRRTKRRPKLILSNINVQFRPARLTAIMGASGAGKTTLLSMLAADQRGTLSGQVLINGEPITGGHMKNISGFVFQDDVILSTMTVREAILMSAILRLPKYISKQEKTSRVDDLLHILQLTHCQSTIIGSTTTRGISGGERKRTSIAMEMVTNPTVLFLDEPTSGLDTFTAYNVMSTLAELAHKQERTVIATIHQPSSEIFHLFDDLLLLADGQVMYCGECQHAIDYFAARGYECPRYSNPSDYFFMAILNKTTNNRNSLSSRMASPSSVLDRSLSVSVSDSADVPLSAMSPEKRIKHLLESWKTSEEAKTLALKMDDQLRDGVPPTALKQNAPFLTQFVYLLGRTAKNALRNKMIIQIKLLQSVVIGLLIGLIFFDIGSKTPQSQVQARPRTLR